MTVFGQKDRIRWRLYAPIYDWMVKPFERGRVRAIDQLDIGADDRVLILGSGTGADLEYLPQGATVTAIDITPAMVKRTVVRATSLDRGVSAQVSDAHNLPFEDDAFDVVLLHLVLSVVPDPETVVAETERVLASDGRVSVFDKFVPEGTSPSLLRRAANPVARTLFSDLTRTLEPMLADTALDIETREWLLGDLYTVAILHPITGPSRTSVHDEGS